MSALAEQVYQSLKTLPEEKIAEVLDFVEFLKLRAQTASDERRQWAESVQRLFREMQALPQASILTEEEIQAEIEAYRAERKCRTSGS